MTILCIEDDADTCELISFVFKQAGYEVLTCKQADCLNMIEEKLFSAVILDNYFGELSGLEICRRIRRQHLKTPVIFFSGEVRRAEIDLATEAGADDYLIKPNDFERLLPRVSELIHKAS